VETVATGDEIAGDGVADAVLEIGDARMIGVEIMRLDVGSLVNRGETGLFSGVHQVAGNLGLPVDGDNLASRLLHVDAMAHPAEGEFDAIMDEAFTVQPVTGADFAEQRHRPFFEQAGADTAEHIVRRLAFQNDAVDAASVEQLSQQQSCRSRADDCYFCPQYLLS
jgi:hypothetical protein